MKRHGWNGHWAIAVAALFASLSMGLYAQTAAQAARLSSVDGQVRILQGDQMLADSALTNTPLFEGTQLATSEDGRAEVQFDDGSVARISPDSSMTLNALPKSASGSGAELVMDTGLGYFELQGAGAPESFRIRFGDSVVTASGFTVLRVNLDNPPGELAVFAGHAHIEIGNAASSGIALDLHEGESIALNATDPSRYRLTEAIEPDSWDSWNGDRDQELANENTQRTPATASLGNSANPGWSELDANGSWYNVPDQGYVWSPYESVGAGWDPYGNGSWVWNPRFGYVWVSGYSWGYMPFQCGSWNFYDRFGWGWAPGMAGCFPWWDRGYYGSNIGSAPGGYLPPRRPHSPVWPPGRGGRPGPHPVIAINRMPSVGGRLVAARQWNAPLVIGGKSIEPLAHFPQRSQSGATSSGFLNAPRPVYSSPVATRSVFGVGGARAGYAPPGNGQPSGRSFSGSGSATGRASFGGSGSGSSSRGSYSGTSHASAGGSSHASGGSSGGGGGGGSHSGGGGGGGGGSHK